MEKTETGRDSGADIRLTKLTPERLEQFFNDKLKAGNSPQLVHYLRVVLRVALNKAVKIGLLGRNAAALTTAPKVEKREILPWTIEHASRFLKAVLGHRWEALYTAALAVGVRSGECSGLRWTDFDHQTETLTIRHTLQRQKGQGLQLMPPKSDKSRRAIELPKVCVKALQNQRKRQNQERLLAGSRWKETGHIFTTTIGTPIDDRMILKEFKLLVKAGKLPDQRFHDLRHACVSLLAAQGVPLKVISEIVGHSDIRLTQNIYQHVYREAKQDAAKKMNYLLTASAAAVQNSVATKVATKGNRRSVN